MMMINRRRVMELEEPNINLIDPTKVLVSKFINKNGNIQDANSEYAVSDFIPTNGKNITATITNSWDIDSSFGARSYAVYDRNKQLIRVLYLHSNVSRTYEYQNGDFYIRIGLVSKRFLASKGYPDYENYYACYGNKLKPYTPYVVDSQVS